MKTKIRIYTIPECPFCKKLKNILDKDGIEYDDINVLLDEHEKEFDKIMEVSKSDAVPTILIGNYLLVPDVNFYSIEQAVEIIKYIQKNNLKTNN